MIGTRSVTSILFGMRSYMRLPSGAFGGLGNIITSGLGILSFGVRISHSATVAPGLPSLSAIFVTLPRFLYFDTNNAFISAGVLLAIARATVEKKSLYH